MNLHPDFKEFLRLLKKHRVRFVVVGAINLAALAKPRYTADLDVFVAPSRANARRLLAALDEFGFTCPKSALTKFATADRRAVLGREPVCIDIMTGISGVTFREAWRGRMTDVVDGIEVPFMGAEQFLKNKRASGRTKDLLDIALYEEVHGPRKR